MQYNWKTWKNNREPCSHVLDRKFKQMNDKITEIVLLTSTFIISPLLLFGTAMGVCFLQIIVVSDKNRDIYGTKARM